MEYDTAIDDELLVRVEDRIAYITMNRPEKRNAISVTMMRRFKEFLDGSKFDKHIAAVVLDGAGKDFCAGHDLLAHKEIGGGKRPWSEDQARAYLDFIFEHLYWPLKDYGKPIIGAVHGNAVGGGAELALICDITIASEDVVFDYDILRATGVIMSQMLIYTAGLKAASEIYLTGGKVYATEALRLGMVNRVVSRQNLLAEAKRLATIISRMPQESVKLSKVAIRHTMDLMGMRQAWFYGKEADILAHLVEGDEVESNIRHDEGVRAAIDWRRNKFLDIDQPFS